MKRQTVGKIASDLQQKVPDTLNPREIQQATEKEYLDNLAWCVDHAKKRVLCDENKGCTQECKKKESFDSDFFIECITKKEPKLENVLRNYFIPRNSCPTPFFDQTVYKYNAQADQIEFLWVVPDKETAEIFKENKEKIVPEERCLLEQVMKYYDGTLFQLAKKFNGETVYRGGALKEK